MIIQLIRTDSILSRYICDDCFENGVGIFIDKAINRDDIIIIRVDSYYNAIVHDPDRSPDCLIIQRCRENVFNIYIIELKNLSSPSGFTIQQILDKFMTCLEDFMSIRFANIFYNTGYTFNQIRLLFISDPYNFRDFPDRQEKMKGHKFDMLMAQRIPKYFGKHIFVESKVPNPTIRSCG